MPISIRPATKHGEGLGGIHVSVDQEGFRRLVRFGMYSMAGGEDRKYSMGVRAGARVAGWGVQRAVNFPIEIEDSRDSAANEKITTFHSYVSRSLSDEQITGMAQRISGELRARMKFTRNDINDNDDVEAPLMITGDAEILKTNLFDDETKALLRQDEFTDAMISEIVRVLTGLNASEY